MFCILFQAANMIGVGAANLLGPGKQLTLSKENALKVLNDFECIHPGFFLNLQSGCRSEVGPPTTTCPPKK